MDDPFEDVPMSRAKTGAPIVEDSSASIDRTVWTEPDGGDHTSYIGDVEALETFDPDAEPSTFYQGS